MIRSFRSKALRLFYVDNDPSKLNVRHTARVRRALDLLEQARQADDVDVPGMRFHRLSGRLQGRYAVDASANWRITFGWDGDAAVDVDLEDYH